MGGGLRIAMGFGLGAMAACQTLAGAFACTTDDQCGADGTCQSTGFCSFPDTACPSEQRYGSAAGDELAGTCVPEQSSGTSGSTSTTLAMESSAGASSSTGASVVDDSTGGGGTTTGTGTQTGGSSESGSGGSSGGSSTGEPGDALVVWYAFDDLAGNVVPDSSENGIDATCVSCLESTTGVSGLAMEFSDVDSIAVAEHDTALEVTALTVSVWIRQNSTACMSIASKPINLNDDNSWQLYTCPNNDGTQDLVAFITANGGSAFAVPFDPKPMEFVHVAMTFEANVLRLYVDGAQQTDFMLDHELTYDDSPLIIGGEDNGNGLVFPFQGALDELRIYGRALSADEIAALAAAM